MYFFSSVLPTESVDAAILSAMFISICFHVCLLLWRVCSARLGDGIYLSCGPRIVSVLHVPVHVY